MTWRSDLAMRAERGFTLIEMLVVIAIIALIGAFVLPQFSGAQAKADMSSAARRLAAGLRTTRSLAMAHGRSEAFTVDVAHGLYRAGAGAAQAIDKHVGVTLVTASQETIDAAEGNIRFYADGSSTGGGIGLRAGTRSTLVLVDWLTGRVSIEETR
jgi:general secretion pathway protein H